MPMARTCSDCFYCRRGAIVTWEPAYTCLHPVSRALGTIAHLAETCPTMRGAEGACGPEAHLFRPKADDSPQPPTHMYRN